MTRVEYRPSSSVLLSMPLSLLLAALFFMPWLEVRCNGTSCDAPGKFGAASGWQLARGEITVEKEFERRAQYYAGGRGLPHKRVWVYPCLALPVLVFFLAGLCVSGAVAPSAAGKLTVLAGLAGLGITIALCFVNYGVGDVLSEVDEVAPRPDLKRVPLWERGTLAKESEAAWRDQVGIAADVEDLATVKATPYLWVSLGLYGLTVLCGMATSTVPVIDRGPVPSPALEFQHEGALAPPSGAVGRPAAGFPVYRPHQPYQANHPGRS